VQNWEIICGLFLFPDIMSEFWSKFGAVEEGRVVYTTSCRLYSFTSYWSNITSYLEETHLIYSKNGSSHKKCVDLLPEQ
jgi:hypothetical protein